MKREVAFKGFYRTLREIQGYEAQAIKQMGTPVTSQTVGKWLK